jgi:hypothetical protein
MSGLWGDQQAPRRLGLDCLTLFAYIVSKGVISPVARSAAIIKAS